jgi:hypothetical protein
MNENDNIDSVYFGTENDHNLKSEQDEAEKKEVIKELTDKYKHIIAQVNILEENKKDLSDKLEGAIMRIKENSDTIDQKNKIIEELEQIKYNFEAKELELYERINELQEKLDIEKSVIKQQRSRSNSAIFNEENLAISNQMENFSIAVNEIRDRELADEIYNKIEEIIISSKDNSNTNSNTSSNYVNDQLANLFNFIKNKLNVINSPSSCDSANSIHKNLDFEITNTSQINSYINLTINEENIKKEKKKFENEKKLILKALEEKADKVN